MFSKVAAVAIAIAIAMAPAAAGAYPLESAEGDAEPPIQRQCQMLGRYSVSVYHIGAQHDNDPFITATGLDIRTLGPSETICALSEESLTRSGGPVEFGDVLVMAHGSQEISAMCRVEDAMNTAYWSESRQEVVEVNHFVDVLTTSDVMVFYREVPVFACKMA